MKCSFTQQIHSLYLGSGGDCDLEKFKAGLEVLLPLVTHEVYLWTFDMTPRMFKFIIEKVHNVKRVIFCHWNMVNPPSYGIKAKSGISVGSEFILNSKLRYRIKELVLFHSKEKSQNVYLDENRFESLVKAMGKTRLRKSLQSVVVKKDWYDDNALEGLFKENGFRCAVKVSQKRPKERW